MTTWYWMLGVLVYFQDTTAVSVPSWQNTPTCENHECQHQPVYKIVQLQADVSNHHPVIHHHPIVQQVPTISYHHPVIQHGLQKCPLEHTIQAQQLYELSDQQKILQNAQHMYTQVLYNTEEEQVQNEYKSSNQQLNNGYLPPHGYHQKYVDAGVNIHQNLQQESHNQQFVNVHSNNPHNHLVNSEVSQHHNGKFKQTVKYDINHQHQPTHHTYSQHQSYNSDAKSSTSIEQHHDLHHHSDGSDDSHEIDISTGKKKKHHDAYYKFDYSVNDHHTGDIKSHKEERSGDEVRGEYSLLEKDGNVRTVKYFADWKTGFHATVHNSKNRS